MQEKIPKNPFSFGVFASKPHKVWALLALLSVFVATGLDRITIIILRNLIDSIAAPKVQFEIVWFWAIAYPILHFVARNVWRASGFTGMRWFTSLRATTYQGLYNYLSFHSKEYFNSRFAGALANKISNAVDGTEEIFVRALWNFIPLFVGIIWYVVFAAISNLLLGAIIAFWSAVFITVNIWFAKKLQPSSYKLAETSSVLKGKVVDSLSNISLVHEYAYVAGERDYIKRYVRKQQEAGLSNWLLSEWVLVANGVLTFVFILLILGFSIYLFQIGLISVGVVVMIIAIVTDITFQLFFLAQHLRETIRFYSQAKEGLDEILQKHFIANIPGATDLVTKNGAIDIESIHFEYENTRVFEDFSLVIPAGQKVGFVGRSGAGKTTLVSLLLRHFDIQSGAIRIDGQNIAEVTLESLRRAIAFVPQDTALFHRTIEENIKYSNPQAARSQVEKAALAAQAHEFIEKLPNGYDTLVGERGVKLSGGQRQRISLARAFLKNSPIIILDEATSSLDSESEQAIQASLAELMKGRTVIAIAHRLSTLKEMDTIVVIDDGRIVEDGPPEALLKNKAGLFKRLWDHQVKGFIIDE